MKNQTAQSELFYSPPLTTHFDVVFGLQALSAMVRVCQSPCDMLSDLSDLESGMRQQESEDTITAYATLG